MASNTFLLTKLYHAHFTHGWHFCISMIVSGIFSNHKNLVVCYKPIMATTQKLPKMAIFTISEQQKDTTSSNFFKLPKLETTYSFQNWQLLFCFEQPQDGVQSYQDWK